MNIHTWTLRGLVLLGALTLASCGGRKPAAIQIDKKSPKTGDDSGTQTDLPPGHQPWDDGFVDTDDKGNSKPTDTDDNGDTKPTDTGGGGSTPGGGGSATGGGGSATGGGSNQPAPPSPSPDSSVTIGVEVVEINQNSAIWDGLSDLGNGDFDIISDD